MGVLVLGGEICRKHVVVSMSGKAVRQNAVSNASPGRCGRGCKLELDTDQ